MLYHSQDFNYLDVRYGVGAVGARLADGTFGHVGTEVAQLRSSL